MKWIIASNNQDKIEEIKAILPDVELVSMKDAGVTKEIEETGTTFEENAVLKAEAVRDLTGQPAVADDSGICVPVLGGKPGVFSARYIGYHGDDEGNLDKLIADMESYDGADRYAYYECAVALAVPGQETIVTKGICGGILLRDKRGENGFGYDPIFYIPYLQRTMAELPPEVKNHLSHRYHALTKLWAKVNP